MASNRFLETANSLRDKLVDNGFERIEAEWLLRPTESQGTFFGAGTLLPEAVVVVPEPPDLSRLDAPFRERTAFDPATSTLAVTGVVSPRQRDALAECFTTTAGRQAADAIYRLSNGLPRSAHEPRRRTKQSECRCLPCAMNGQLQLFDEDCFRERRGTWRTAMPHCRRPNIRQR